MENQKIVAQAFNESIPKILDEQNRSVFYLIEWITFDGRVYGGWGDNHVTHYLKFQNSNMDKPYVQNSNLDSLFGENNSPIRVREISEPDNKTFYMVLSCYGRPTFAQLDTLKEITKRATYLTMFAEESIWARKISEKLGATLHIVDNKKLVGFD